MSDFVQQSRQKAEKVLKYEKYVKEEMRKVIEALQKKEANSIDPDNFTYETFAAALERARRLESREYKERLAAKLLEERELTDKLFFCCERINHLIIKSMGMLTEESMRVVHDMYDTMYKNVDMFNKGQISNAMLVKVLQDTHGNLVKFAQPVGWPLRLVADPDFDTYGSFL